MRLSETQSRVVYSLLKPAVRAAARFGLPIRTVVDLVRLAYFEELRGRGLSNAEIAQVFGQSDRHMRSLAGRLESDFFAAEREVGLVREVEAEVASSEPTDDGLRKAFSGVAAEDLRHAVATLLEERRIERVDDGRLVTARPYVTLNTEGFKHRIDAINHFMDGGYRAVLHRMIFNDGEIATLKTISFSALGDELKDVWARLEGALRRDIAELDEHACFEGHADERYTLALALAPARDEEA